MATSRYYDEEKAAGQFFPGVPARDLTEEEYDALPDWLQRSVDGSPMYRSIFSGVHGTPSNSGPSHRTMQV